MDISYRNLLWSLLAFSILLVLPIVSAQVQLGNQSVLFEPISNTTIRLENNANATTWDVNGTYQAVLIYNITTDTRFTNINNTFKAFVNFYQLTNALVFNTTGGTPCANSTCNGNFNITANSGHNITILPVFNLTQGVSRSLSPLWIASNTFTANRRTQTVIIASNLTTAINTTTIFTVDNCNNIQSIVYTANSGFSYSPTYSCNNGTVNPLVTLTALNQIENSATNNILVVSYGNAITSSNICPTIMNGFSSFFTQAPLIFTILGIVLLIGIITFFGLFLTGKLDGLANSSIDFNGGIIKAGFIFLLVLSLIAVIAIIAINAVCTVGV